MTRFYPFLFLFLFFTACIKVVDIDTDTIPNKLVVNCLFTEGQAFKVSVSRLAAYTDTTNRELNNAIVQIFANGTLLGKLDLVDEGIYSDSTILPQYGNRYSIEVSSPNYPTVMAVDSLPAKTEIEEVEIVKNAGVDGDGESYDKVAVTFTDLDEDDYYLVMIYKSWVIEEFVEKWYPLELSSSDPAILAEGISEGEFPEYFVFNDKLFNGKTYKLHVNIGSYIDFTDGIIFLETGSENYYNYRKTLLKHKSYTYQSPFEAYEPTPIYSNITNGLGIFAGYQRTRSEVCLSN